MERQITHAAYGHVLTNTGVWSPDGQWIVYDVRPDSAGAVFEGDRIEQVHVETGEVRVAYHARDGARCGVVTYHPFEDKVVFILGPERPTADWDYGPSRRQGLIVDTATGVVTNLDARDLVPPFTAGALRGGSHVHVFSPDGRLVSFTYDDQVGHAGQRNVGVATLGRAVTVPRSHSRNHDGGAFCVLVSRTTASPRPGSDEIRRAFEDAWVGGDRHRPSRAIAFIGEVISETGEPISEVFVADLPEELTVAGDGPMAGTATALPAPPAGVVQRRLTRTGGRRFPGVCGPRHWVRSSPDGGRIAFLMKDDAGVAQVFTVSPAGGSIVQVTHNGTPISSAFTWSPDGRRIAHVMDGSVCVTDAATGVTTRVTERTDPPPRPEACVFSPDGSRVAYVRTVGGRNQIFVVPAPLGMPTRA